VRLAAWDDVDRSSSRRGSVHLDIDVPWERSQSATCGFVRASSKLLAQPAMNDVIAQSDNEAMRARCMMRV
jgi:hypothetical protein